MTEVPTATGIHIRSAGAIDAMDWVVMDGTHHVEHKILWQEHGSVAGLMRLGPDAWMAPHVHRRGHHHVWLIDGEGTCGGRTLPAGSYVHVPVGVEHELGAGPEGCRLLYLYLR